MTSDPTLLFCVGAAKSGTSWLHKFLGSHPEAHVRSVKELHYFDALDCQNQNWQITDIRKRVEILTSRMNSASDKKCTKFQLRIDDCNELIALLETGQESVSDYLGFLNTGRQNETVIADITPAYGLLSEQRLGKMAQLATNVRFVYILRDPVSRLWSHIRMIAGRSSDGKVNVQIRADEIFTGLTNGKHGNILERSDYRATLERLNNALEPSQLLVVFFEELFSYKTIERICNFLGIGLAKARLDLQVHVGPKASMSDKQHEQAQLMLARQYDYVNARFEHLPDAWQANMSGVKI